MVDSAVDLADKHIIRVFILDDHELSGAASPTCSVPRTILRSSEKRRPPERRCDVFRPRGRTSPSSMRGCPMAAGSRSAETSARLIPKSAV
jgi:hypothetical protein